MHVAQKWKPVLGNDMHQTKELMQLPTGEARFRASAFDLTGSAAFAALVVAAWRR
jgi:hypothetical protein